MKIKKGISLIVLVITIIVIIILAGAVILSLSKNNPIAKASEATFKANVQAYNSELALAISSKYVNDFTFSKSMLNAGIWDGNPSNISGTIKSYITTISVEDGKKFEIQGSKLVYVGDVINEQSYITDIGLPNKAQLTLVIGTIATENSTVNGRVSAYNNPIIPTGFRAVNDGAIWPTDWNKGLVIEDALGNQFVWVPVDGTNVKYLKNFTYPSDFSASSLNTTDDTLPIGITSEIEQIKDYGGFYIARYEAGKINIDTLVSKKSTQVWAFISYYESKSKAESMYNTTSVQSGLVTGTQWDTTMMWIEKLALNVSTNSNKWGNYIDSITPANAFGFGIKQVTGYSEFWKANNIYDLSGNLWEWTNEKFGSVFVTRGGSWLFSAATFPAAFRIQRFDSGSYLDWTFRVVLYIK